MEQSYVLIDADARVYEDSWDLSESYAGKSVSVAKRRLHGGVQEGLDVVEITTDRVSFTVLASRGMNVLRARCDDVDLKWDSPVGGPVHPNFVPIFAPNGVGWLEGFSEWIARCGLESNGAPEFDKNGVLKYPLHGRLSNLPARRVEVGFDSESGVLRITGVMYETSVFGRKFRFTTTYRLKVDETKIQVEDSVENLASVDDEFELLYHINTGNPLVAPGSKFLGTFEKMCPRDQNAVAELGEWNSFREPIPGVPETCYFFDLATDEDGNAEVALVNAQNDRAFKLSFNKKDFPYFILWKTQRPNSDIYVSGMEPAINFPNTRSFEKSRGRVMPIAAGEKKTFRFALDVLLDKDEVESFALRIEKRQASARGEIVKEPIADWCE